MKSRKHNRGNWKRENKYSCIVKVDATKFVKYTYVRNLLKFTAFLDLKFEGWRFMNVFDRTSRRQIASFTKNRKPTSHSVII